MVNDVLYLQLILVVGVIVAQMSELLSEVEAMGHVLWRHEVLCHFDAIVQVANLNTNGGTLILHLINFNSVDQGRIPYSVIRGRLPHSHFNL